MSGAVRGTLAIFRRSNLRHLRERPRRALLTVAGIAAGVCLLLAVRAIDTTLRASIDADARGLAGDAPAEITGPGGRPLKRATARRVARAPGVADTVSVVRTLSKLRAGDDSATAAVLGVPSNLGVVFPGGLGKVGAQLPLLERRSRTVLVSHRLYAKLGLRRGRSLSIQTPVGRRRVRVVELERGPFAGIDGGYFALVRLGTAQRWFHRHGRVDTVYPAAERGTDPKRLREALDRRLGDDVEVSKPGARAEGVQQTFNSIASISEQATTVALFVAVFVVLNTLSMSTAERRRELAGMLATGAGRGMLVGSLLVEAALMGLVGALVGGAAGLALARLLLGQVLDSYSILPITAAGPLVVATKDLVLAGVAGPLVGVLGATVPALRIMRARIVEALRPDSSYEWTRVREHRTGRLPLLGAALLVGAIPVWALTQHGGRATVVGSVAVVVALTGIALMLPTVVPLAARPVEPLARRLFGPVGRIAAGGMRRSPGRATLTAGGLAIASAMVLGVGGGLGSFEHQVDRTAHEWYSAPLYVAVQSPSALQPSQPLVPEVGYALSRTKGVKAAYPMRLALLDNRDRQMMLYAFPLVEAALAGDQTTRGVGISQRGLLEGIAPDSVVVSREMQRRLDLEVGDRVRVPITGHRHRFKVAAFFNDLGNFDTLYMEHDVYRRLTGDQDADRYAVIPQPGASVKRLKKRIAHLLRRRQIPAQVLTGERMGDLIVSGIAPLFSMARAIQAASLLVAAIIVATTMLTAIFERQRELALQRALGMRGRDLAGTVLVESASLGTVGAAIAIPLGVLIAFLVKFPMEQQVGWRIPFEFPTALAVGTLGAAIGVAVVAAIYPSRIAARVAIVQALRQE